MTTLSRLVLPSANPTVRRRLSNRQVLHAIVEAASAAGTVDEGRTLWRIDGGAPKFQLYVVAPGPIDAEHLAGEFGLEASDVQMRDYGPVLSRLARGQEWRFRFRGNPSRSVAREGRHSTRVALRGEPRQVQWLVERSNNWGFSIPTNRLGVPEVITREVDEASFVKGASGHRVTLAGVTFDGVLRIEEPQALAASLTGGMGHGRAYGLGLMTLAPING